MSVAELIAAAVSIVSPNPKARKTGGKRGRPVSNPSAKRAREALESYRKLREEYTTMLSWPKIPDAMAQRFEALSVAFNDVQRLFPDYRKTVIGERGEVSARRRRLRKSAEYTEAHEVLGWIDTEDFQQTPWEFAARRQAYLRPTHDDYDIVVRFRADDSLEFASVGRTDNPRASLEAPRVADGSTLRRPRLQTWEYAPHGRMFPKRFTSDCEYAAQNAIPHIERGKLHFANVKRDTVRYSGNLGVRPDGSPIALPSNNPPPQFSSKHASASNRLPQNCTDGGWLPTSATESDGWDWLLGPPARYDRTLRRFHAKQARQARIASAKLPLLADGSARVILQAPHAVFAPNPKMGYKARTAPLSAWRRGPSGQTVYEGLIRRILAALGTPAIAQRKRGRVLSRKTGKLVTRNLRDAQGNYLLTGKMFTLTARRAERIAK